LPDPAPSQRRLATAKLPATARDKPRSVASDKPRVVIADDDRTVRFLARLAMEQAGFEVTEATDGVQAIEAIKQRHPDLVLLDVTMPVMDGFTACAALRRLPDGERIPVIIITGLDDVESINAAYDAGATDFVTKPINWAVLGHRVRYIMRASRALNEVWENQKRLANAQRLADMGDWDWDITRSLFRASEQVYRLLGKSAERTLASIDALLEDVHREDRDRVRAAIDAAVDRGESFTLDHRIIMPGGQVRFVHHQVEPTRTDDTGRATRLVGTLQDITRRKHSEERIRQLAYFDSLTGLPNRLLLIDQLKSALAHAERNAGKLAVMFVDLDGFKRVNDTLGHDAGDELLRIVAGRISSSVRATDAVSRIEADEASASIARLGGDEFVVLLSQIEHAEDATSVARRMLQALVEPMLIAGQEIVISCSIGIALYPQDGETTEAMLMNADAAMYRAKGKGRNTFQYYDPSMNATAREKLSLENALRHAIERDELELRFQPKVDISSGEIVGVESLLRWHHPDKGWVPPREFIDLARQTQLIIPIEEWVIHTACRTAQPWRNKRGDALRIGINLSGSYLRRAELLPSIERMLAATGMEPSRLELEIAAAVLLEDADTSYTLIRRLSELGIRFTVDEFGAGFASLPQLKRLPISTLKIDRSFVADVLTDTDDAAICGSIIALAHGLGLTSIAEGVETAAQLELLRRLGCDYFQGELFCAPVRAEEIGALLGVTNTTSVAEPSATAG
jgi:diguanylate cyclase (GGDEF)-like protein